MASQPISLAPADNSAGAFFGLMAHCAGQKHRLLQRRDDALRSGRLTRAGAAREHHDLGGHGLPDRSELQMWTSISTKRLIWSK